MEGEFFHGLEAATDKLLDVANGIAEAHQSYHTDKDRPNDQGDHSASIAESGCDVRSGRRNGIHSLID